MATTAVGAVVIGLALQDTLGNLFAGLAIQIEKPFRVGDWVTIGGQDGMVSEITWRATKMRTKAGNFVVVPNSVLAKDTIIELLRADAIAAAAGRSRRELRRAAERREGGHSRGAAERAGAFSHERAPEVLLVDFGDFGDCVSRAVLGRAISRPTSARRISCASLIYYAFKRNNITIPYPIQVEMSAEEGGVVPVRRTVGADALAAVALFSPLAAERARRAAGRREAGAIRRWRSDRSPGRRPAGRCSSSFAARRPSRSPARTAKWLDCATAMCSARCRC